MTPDGLLQWSDFARGLRTLARKSPALIRTALAVGFTRSSSEFSLGTLIQRRACEQGERPAVKSADGELTYAQLNARANRTAHWLRAQGVVAGDTVAILMQNRPEMLVSVVACAKLGVVASMLNTHQRRGALAHSLSCAPPAAIVVGAECGAALEEVLSPPKGANAGTTATFTLGGRRPLVGWVADPAGSSESPAGLAVVDVLKARQAHPSVNPVARVTFADDLFYIFTSGTTGLPKASIMSHKRWIGAGYMFGATLLGLANTDTIYCPLPLYHNQALTMAWSAAVHAGAAIAIRRSLSISDFWLDCARFDATAIAYIGEVARYLLAAPSSPQDRAHRVRKAAGVGMRPALWHDFKSRFGLDHIYEFYSASELNVGFFNLMGLDQTVGVCPGTWALVDFDVDAGEPRRDSAGRLIRLKSPGDVGLLLTEVSARFKFEGYTDADATERKLIRGGFADGDCWVNTGDLMRRMGFGHLQFVDRVGDTFRWKGENVATSEVEGVISSVKGVEDVTVYGVEVPGFSGRAGMAAVVASGGGEDGLSPTVLKALGDMLSRELPAYAVPVFIRGVDSLEVTGTYKHKKTGLRKAGYGDGVLADVWVNWPGLGYVALTPERYSAIGNETVRL